MIHDSVARLSRGRYAKLHSLSLKTTDLSVWLLTDFVSAPYLLRELFRIFIGRPGVKVRTRKVV